MTTVRQRSRIKKKRKKLIKRKRDKRAEGRFRPVKIVGKINTFNKNQIIKIDRLCFIKLIEI